MREKQTGNSRQVKTVTQLPAPLDIMLEAKAKDVALLWLRQELRRQNERRLPV